MALALLRHFGNLAHMDLSRDAIWQPKADTLLGASYAVVGLDLPEVVAEMEALVRAHMVVSNAR